MPRPRDWNEEATIIDELLRAISFETDPQSLAKLYGQGVRRLFPVQDWLAISRRGLSDGAYRVTRSERFKSEINPWRQTAELPLFTGGLLSELIYGNAPKFFDDIHIPDDEPAHEFIGHARSLYALPAYENGESLNMTLLLSHEPFGFEHESLPKMLWQANLVGRSVLNLVLRKELADAYNAIREQVDVVAEIQRSLLPQQLPNIPGTSMAALYETSEAAGGDYYDLFPLPDGRWGLLIADVSGHGPAAAVIMAVTHALAHTYPGPPQPAAALLGRLNHALARLYSSGGSTFVTAFYGVFDPRERTLIYANAGHNPPRLRNADGRVVSVDGVGGLPLGIDSEETLKENTIRLNSGDVLVLYTDGIVEAMDGDHELFGLERLDSLLAESPTEPQSVVDATRTAIAGFTRGRTATDDRTLVVMKVV